MSEIIEAAKFLSGWPVAEGFFIIVIAFLGIMTYRRADRDRKTYGPSALEIPLYLVSGPLHDAMMSVHEISEQSRTQNELIRQLIQEVRRNNELLEWSGNQIGLLVPPSRRPGR